MHDKYRCQSTYTDGDRVNDITGYSLRELRYFNERRGSRIEKTAVDREGKRSHRLVVDDLRFFRENWHQYSKKYAGGVHEDRADKGEPAAVFGIIHHYFLVFLMS